MRTAVDGSAEKSLQQKQAKKFTNFIYRVANQIWQHLSVSGLAFFSSL